MRLDEIVHPMRLSESERIFEEREMMEFLLGVIGVVNPLLDIPSGKVSKSMGVDWPGLGEISLS